MLQPQYTDNLATSEAATQFMLQPQYTDNPQNIWVITNVFQ